MVKKHTGEQKTKKDAQKSKIGSLMPSHESSQTRAGVPRTGSKTKKAQPNSTTRPEVVAPTAFHFRRYKKAAYRWRNKATWDDRNLDFAKDIL